jgi:hypothetical protein
VSPSAQTGKQDVHELLLLIQGFQITRILKAAADLGLADRIEPGANLAVADLAALSHVEPERLRRLCRALAAMGVFTIDETGQIGHSKKSLLLRTDSKPSLHYMARFWGTQCNWATWGAFEHGLQDGQTAAQIALGLSRMEYFKAHPDEADIYNAAMAHKPEDSHSDVVTAYDFSGSSLIIDVGGGTGTLLRNILSHYRDPQGVTFDRHEVIRPARECGRLAALGTRHRFEEGDFFEQVPKGGDVYLLNDVTGNCSDEQYLVLLQNIRAATQSGGRLLVIERVPDDHPADGDPIDYLIDLHFMLSNPDASLRSVSEHRSLLAPAGFRPTRVIPTASSVSIIEAIAE